MRSASWQRTRLDRVSSVNARIGWRALTASEYQEEGFAFLSTPNIKGVEIDYSNVNYISHFRFDESPELKLRHDDVLLAKDGSTLGIVNVVRGDPGDATVNGSIAVIRPRSIDGRFLKYSIESAPIQALIQSVKDGMGVPHLFQWDIKRFPLLAPPLVEQRAIADYLDAETARIDALIAKKQQLIHLLEERSRLIGETALEEMRARCEKSPLKHLVRESDRRLGAGIEPLVLSVSIHHGVVPRADISDKESRADDFSNYKTCEPGQLAINRMRAFQGGVGVVRDRGVVSPDYTVLTLGPKVVPEFMHFLMRSEWFVSEMTKRLRGIGATDQGAVRTPRVNFADLGLIEVPVPAISEQASLADQLGIGRASSMNAARAIGRQVALLAERRQALITAAVTGEFTVPGAA